MKLGEAYVNIRANLKPYHRDLQAGLRATTAAFEKQLNKDLGRRFGKQISTGARESLVEGAKETARDVEKALGSAGSSGGKGIRQALRRSTRRGMEDGLLDALSSGQKFATFIGSALASALDDGISALPVEMKAAISAGLILVAPVVVSQLGAAISGAVAVGIAGLGVGLATQLAPVQEAWTMFVSQARNSLAAAAGPFIDPILRGLATAATVIDSLLAPKLENLFASIAPGFEYLLNTVTRIVSGLFARLEAEAPEINGFLIAAADAAELLADAIGDALVALLDTGVDGQRALRELGALVAFLVRATVGWVIILTKLLGIARDVYNLVSGNAAQIGLDAAVQSGMEQEGLITRLTGGYNGLVVATDAETKALQEQAKAAEDANKALEKMIKDSEDLIDAQINKEEAWDKLTEAIKENGNSLKISDEEGRENAENAKRYLGEVADALKGRVEAGEITADEAEVQLQREITKLEKLFGTTKEGRARFEELFGTWTRLLGLRFDPSPWIVGFNAIGSAIKGALDRLKELQKQAKKGLSGDIKVSGGTQIAGFAEGGRITEPSMIMAGEGYRPELVLPETDPRRAAQLLSNSSLGAMLGGGPTVVYAVFDGEPFQARIVRTAQSVNRTSARTLSMVPRRI